MVEDSVETFITQSVPVKMTQDPFWRYTPLSEMSWRQWEMLCDGCGRCCLRKLEHARTGEVVYTSIACRLLDIERCRCTDYSGRTEAGVGCLRLSPGDAGPFSWLPRSCAYRILYEGGDLPSWHPLITGDPESVHKAGMSVRHCAVAEVRLKNFDLERYIIDIDC